MKAKEVQINGVYAVKVGRNITGVRITQENPHGGWDGVNVKTNKAVRIKSPQRLRGPWKRDGVAQTPAASPTVAPGEDGANQSAPDTKPTKKADPGQPDAKVKTCSGLDAAARVLTEVGQPLNCSTMINMMLEKGYWQTSGKTPANTLYAAIAREIKTKGNDSRFAKAERGKFTLASNA